MSLAILCAGQGLQHGGMLNLVADDAHAQTLLLRAAVSLGFDVRARLDRAEELFENRFAQPCICVTELATWSALRERLPAPLAFAGYSVGELAAYACAGSLDAEELVKLAARRAELMDAACARQTGLLAVSGVSREQVLGMCADHEAWLAIANPDESFVVGAERPRLATLEAAAALLGARVTQLRVGLAAHTPLLSAAVQPFAQALLGSTFRDPEVPVVAGVDATWVNARAAAIQTLSVQPATTIEWARCLDALFERGCRVFLEIGPGAALARMALQQLSGVEARSVDDFRSIAGLVAWVERALARSDG
jgi:[acyl-carrier-protein] S-malonyltransferase